MTANQLLEWVGSYGVSVTLNGDNLRVDIPAEGLTDQLREKIKHYIKCYKTELLWRLRHPDGDPGASGYSAKLFVNGERVAVPLDQLISEGQAMIESGEVVPSNWARKNLNPEMLAGAMAVRRYDQRHRESIEEEGSKK